jgi:hypothetical protein
MEGCTCNEIVSVFMMFFMYKIKETVMSNAMCPIMEEIKT